MSRPRRELGVRMSAFAFPRRFFLKVTVDIPMGKIISELEYLKVNLVPRTFPLKNGWGGKKV